MHYRRLGDSGMLVSTLALGGWINYGEGKVAADPAKQVVERAYQRGIRYFDLADIYGKGQAEEQMGALLSQYPRHTLVLASKVFWPMSDDVNDKGLSRKHIMESVDKSLKRLGTDYLDMYFCHRADPDTPLEETARAMDDLIHQGKVLYWGTSEWSADQISTVYELCERYNLYKPKVEQPQYSLLRRFAVEDSVAPVVATRGIGLVVWSPLAGGMLTGKYDAGVPEDSRFAREDWAKQNYMTPETVAKVQQFKAIADELGVTRAQLSLAWALHNPAVNSVIIGATRPEQVDDNVKAAELVLSPDVVSRIEAIFPPVDPDA